MENDSYVRWLDDSRKMISQRLHWMLSRPDGILYNELTAFHRAVVRKEGTLIRLFFVDPRSPQAVTERGIGKLEGRRVYNPVIADGDFMPSDSEEPQKVISGCMSELDLRDPLDLIIAYTQALLLPLLWNPSPQRVYMIGFAGGRIPMVMHHYFPQIVIESTEIDAGIIPVAERFFGVVLDRRQKVIVNDGREYLATRSVAKPYDFIMIDAFRGTGYQPYHLATTEFYELCKRSLAGDGVVATNLIGSDPLFFRKLSTLERSFRHVYLHYDPTFVETYVAVATDAAALDESTRVSLADRIQSSLRFPFPFKRRAVDLKPLSEQIGHLSGFGQTTTAGLTDADLPDVIRSIPRSSPIFFNVSRNSPCPCGSGRKFKQCHGTR